MKSVFGAVYRRANGWTSGVGYPDAVDPFADTEWPDDRHIPGDLIARLITGPAEPGAVAPSLRIRGAQIVGVLNFEYATLLWPLVMEGCRLDRVILEQATAVEIRVERCQQFRPSSGTDLRSTFNVVLSGTRCQAGARPRRGARRRPARAHLTGTCPGRT